MLKKNLFILLKIRVCKIYKIISLIKLLLFDHMKNFHHYKPITYFLWTLGVTWTVLSFAAYFSYHATVSHYQIPFLLVALFTPFIVALVMIYGSKSARLRSDFHKRLFDIRLIKPRYWAFVLCVMPCVLLLATTLSLFFGQPLQQFLLSPELTLFGGETLLIVIILILAPTFEEIGWRGYGVDSLKQGRTLLLATLFYALLWNLWHVPFFFINGYYQNELIHLHPIYAINFIVSLVPAAFLMNWLYYRNNRSIILIIVFHVMLNLFSVILQTEQFTKCIITLILSVIAGFILWKERDFFAQ